MRMPWIKSKGEQLDLLEATAITLPDLNSIAEPSTGSLAADEPILPTSCDALAFDEFADRPLVVSIERLHEDLDNPRTEFPEAQLDELADDIRQRGILQPIVVHPADGSGHHRIHFGAMRVDAIKGEKTLAELSKLHDVHANQIVDWKNQLLDRAASVFGAESAVAP